MENKNFVYKGWRTSGFLMLAVDLLLLAGSVAGIVFGAMRLDDALPGGGWLLSAGIVGVLVSLLLMGGFMLLEPNEARVMVFFGNYRGTFYETGYWWVNPFMSAKPISMRARNLNVDPIKVNDKTGNPILIGLVLVWRIKRDDIYKAVFEIDAASATPEQGVNATERMNILQNFVNVQSDAALRQVAGCYAYDDNGTRQEALTLRSNSEEINQQLETKLNERLAMAGIEVVEARINYLAYAPEIAAVMLRRQQADAETRVLRVAGTSGEGEIYLFLEGLVGGRLPEIIDDAPQKGSLFGSLRRQRGVGVAERVAVGGADGGLLGMRREVHACAYEEQNGGAAQHPGLFVLFDGFVEGLLVGVGKLAFAQEHQLPLLRYDHQHELVVAVAQRPRRA